LLCATRAEFQKRFPSASNAAWREGWMDEVCAHMGAPRRLSWTLEEVKQCAQKCASRKEFRERFNGACQWAAKQGKLDEICSHMPAPPNRPEFDHSWRWNLEGVMHCAMQCNSRGEFQDRFSGAYQWAAKQEKLDEVCSHMAPIYESWNMEKIRAVAVQCETRWEFSKRFPGAYDHARDYGCLDEACSHMPHYAPRQSQTLIQEELPLACAA
jgi:hypothetical protein